ncbi:Co2+/Mg2+ efflux protein ApaG [Ectothiorhodospiraceae bacterium WFHF3C12]|nr:Co2+/Mg2+ efflux protein ApaG [Ectothiorhodospiraceae bacterium WFHF3C12]
MTQEATAEELERYSLEIEVEPAYLDAQSDPEADRYAFSYTVTIRNNGTVAIRLLRRRWLITDADGNEREVRGEGVIGEQPYLAPGDDYRYSSGTVLNTPVGAMRGSYRMQAEDGAEFDATIDAFTLAVPGTLH